uniref:Protein PsbN n=1 Tax=Karenia brevis TaxID=156230 RepID=A0A0S2QDB1_KARBR|nr:photosystem II subunit N [Karenia brevis]
MEAAAFVTYFVLGLLVGITGYSIYTAFGAGSSNLRDPFEEHETTEAITLHTPR